MVTYVTKYAVDVPYEQTVHRISNASKQPDCVEIFLNKNVQVGKDQEKAQSEKDSQSVIPISSLKSLYFVCSCMSYIETCVVPTCHYTYIYVYN